MEYTPLELASIYESRAKMTEDLIRRHEEGELQLDCVECRRKDVEEFRAVAETIRFLLKEVSEAKGRDADHQLLVGQYAAENTRLRALLDTLKVGVYNTDRHNQKMGPRAGESYLMVNFYVNGEEEIKEIEKWLGS